MMKVSDIVKFVLANRQNDVCKNWSPYQITMEIGKALKSNALSYATDTNDRLIGVVWGEPDAANRVLHVDVALTTDKQAFKMLIRYFARVYRGWTITAYRRDKFKIYNTTKLIRKLSI